MAHSTQATAMSNTAYDIIVSMGGFNRNLKGLGRLTSGSSLNISEIVTASAHATADGGIVYATESTPWTIKICLLSSSESYDEMITLFKSTHIDKRVYLLDLQIIDSLSGNMVTFLNSTILNHTPAGLAGAAPGDTFFTFGTNQYRQTKLVTSVPVLGSIGVQEHRRLKEEAAELDEKCADNANSVYARHRQSVYNEIEKQTRALEYNNKMLRDVVIKSEAMKKIKLEKIEKEQS